MSVNKEKINGDLKKAFKFVYSIVRIILHLGLFGALLYYAFYTNSTGLQDASLFGQFLILELSGGITLFIVVPFFHLLHNVETRYFTGSYKMAYILFKYIMPFSKGQIECFDHELVCQGYEEVVKRGNKYYGIEERDGESNENI